MSYWPAPLWASANHFSSVTPYSSSRNSMSKPASDLASGMIFSLNGVRPPSANAPMMTLPPAPSRCEARSRAGGEAGASPAPPAGASATERQPEAINVSHRSPPFVGCTMHHGGTGRVEEARVRGIEGRAEGRADRCGEPALGADGEPLVADAHVDEGLVAHRLDDVDLAGERRGLPGSTSRRSSGRMPRSGDAAGAARRPSLGAERQRGARDQEAVIVDDRARGGSSAGCRRRSPRTGWRAGRRSRPAARPAAARPRAARRPGRPWSAPRPGRG